MAFIRWVAGFIFAVFLAGFSVLNLEPVSIVWSPLHAPLELPLYLIGLLLLAIGFVFGGFMVWLNNAPIRGTKRKQARIIKSLEKQLEESCNKPAPDIPPSEFFPTLASHASTPHTPKGIELKK